MALSLLLSIIAISRLSVFAINLALPTPPISGETTIAFDISKSLLILSKKTEAEKKYTYDVKIDAISLPIKKGDVVGKVIVKDGNKKVQTVGLTVSENIDSLSFFELFFKGITDLISGKVSFAIL